MPKITDFPAGSIINIEIASRAAEKRPRAPEPPKGLLRPRREDDYLARRLKSIYLNFYDLGQIRDGDAWKDINFEAAKTITVSSNQPQHTEDLDLSDWNNLKDKLFEIPIEEWSNQYRKFDYERAERYGVDVYLGNQALQFQPDKYLPVGRNGSRNKTKKEIETETVSDSKWTDKGLKVEKQTEERFAIFTQNGFININVCVGAKITAEANYSAASVPFIIDKSTDIFLVPYLPASRGDCLFAGNIPGYLNYFYAPLPREIFLESAYLDALVGAPVFAKRSIIKYEPAGDFSAALRESLILRDESRLFKGGAGFVAESLFPNDYAATFSRSMKMLDQNQPDAEALIREGALMAVAKKADEYFYFWATFDVVNSQYVAGESQFINLNFS